MERDIPISLLRQILLYDPESGLFRWKVRSSHRVSVGDIAGTVSDNGYRKIFYKGKPYYAHRLAWLYVYGQPALMNIDHINGVRDDNRIANLQLLTQSHNVAKSKISKANTSGVRGVFWDKRRKKWIAQIKVNYKQIYLGRFDSKEEAEVCRDLANKKYFPNARIGYLDKVTCKVMPRPGETEVGYKAAVG